MIWERSQAPPRNKDTPDDWSKANPGTHEVANSEENALVRDSSAVERSRFAYIAVTPTRATTPPPQSAILVLF